MDRFAARQDRKSQVVRALAKAKQNARLAASAKTFNDRDFHERMHKKWLAIAGATHERQIQSNTVTQGRAQPHQIIPNKS